MFLQRTQPRFLLFSRVIMGFGGGAFLVRAVILVRLMFPGKDRVFAHPGSTWNSILSQSSIHRCHGLDLRYVALELRLSLGFPLSRYRSIPDLEVCPSAGSLFAQREVLRRCVGRRTPDRRAGINADCAQQGRARRMVSVALYRVLPARRAGLLRGVFSGGTGVRKTLRPFCICAPSGGKLRCAPPFRSSPWLAQCWAQALFVLPQYLRTVQDYSAARKQVASFRRTQRGWESA
jgi:hypothetical protein